MIRPFYGYLRVSTTKQGEQGVSLQEQREAVSRYARHNNLQILEWFEEMQTAAKRGRPVFTRMLKLLKKGKAAGVIMHKIDRSARNLKDWADLGELIDSGVAVHFANESLDLLSRGGRLSADIQAVVAADYIRNLREEARKGFYGRLKQGLYPLPAPIGYLDRGKGEPKEIDPVKGPLVRRAFQLYATGSYGLLDLVEKVDELGLRNRKGGAVSKNGVSTVLNNPFYAGIIRLKSTGETFQGVHEPLILIGLFDRVQTILRGKTQRTSTFQRYLFSRLIRCSYCGFSLVGERQKGRIYYRCHIRECPTTTLREDVIDEAVSQLLSPLGLSDEEKECLAEEVERLRGRASEEREKAVRTQELRLAQIAGRSTRLTDALLDGAIDKPGFDERKAALLLEHARAEEALAELRTGPSPVARAASYLELAKNASLSYQEATLDEKRELLETLTSNRTAAGKKLVLELSQPFREIANRHKILSGDPYRDRPRTFHPLLQKILQYLEHRKRREPPKELKKAA